MGRNPPKATTVFYLVRDMIPQRQTIDGKEFVSVSEALRMLAGRGCEVTRIWLYLKVRGRDRSNTTYVNGDKRTNYSYQIPPLLEEGKHYVMSSFGKREFVYLNQTGVDLLEEEHRANQNGGSLIRKGYSLVEKRES